MNNSLLERLKRINRRVQYTEALSAFLSALATLIVFLLLAVAIDVIFGLPTWGLITLDIILTIVFIYGLSWVTNAIRNYRFDPRRTARLVEQRTGLNQNELINAVDLNATSDKQGLLQLIAKTSDTTANKITPNADKAPS